MLLSRVVGSLTVAAVLLGGAAARAEEPAGQQSQGQLSQNVERLIERLDSNARAVRVQAERELLSLGPDILPLLPAPEQLKNPAIENAIRRIRVELEHRKAQASVQPSLVTFEGTLPLEKLLQEVAEQTGNSLEFEHLPAKTKQQAMTVDFDGRPFWSAMDEVARQVPLRYDFSGRADRLRLNPASKETPRDESAVVYAGAFRVAVKSAQLRPLFGDRDHQIVRFQLGLIAEPKVRPLFLKYSSDDMSARSASGTVFEPFTTGAQPEIPLGERGRQLDIRLDFKVPVSAELSQIGLNGRFQVQTAAGTQPIVFSDLTSARQVARRRGGVMVTLEQAQFQSTDNNQQQADVQVTVTYDRGGPAFESHRTWLFHNEVYLQTEDGSRIELNSGPKVSFESDGAIAIRYRFNDLKQQPEQYRFVYVAPTLIVDIPVEFEFSGIPVSNRQQERQRKQQP